MKTPKGWNEIDKKLDGSGYWCPSRNQFIICSIAKEKDGKKWLHVSLSGKKRIQYEDLKDIKDLFIGPDKYAIMIFPPKDKYVNIHPNCFHLFHCIDGHALPEFSGFLEGIKGRTL